MEIRVLADSAKFRPFGNAAADGVVLVGGQGDGGQDADNGDDDHQFDQGKTFFALLSFLNPII